MTPLGPNYEAVNDVLRTHHSSLELVLFGIAKLAATAATLGAGGVSAMFVPVFLTGGSFGTAFAQTVVGSGAVGLYAAVGMASFIAAAYKTPLAACGVCGGGDRRPQLHHPGAGGGRRWRMRSLEMRPFPQIRGCTRRQGPQWSRGVEEPAALCVRVPGGWFSCGGS